MRCSSSLRKVPTMSLGFSRYDVSNQHGSCRCNQADLSQPWFDPLHIHTRPVHYFPLWHPFTESWPPKHLWIQYEPIWYNMIYNWLIMHKSWRPKIHDCIRLHGLFIYSNSRAKVLRRPPSLTEEGSMVLLLHMWLNDFPAARDLIRAAKSHRCQLYIFARQKAQKGKVSSRIIGCNSSVSWLCSFFWGGGQLHVEPIGLQGPVASNPRKTSEEMGSGPPDKLRNVNDPWFYPAAVWLFPHFEWFYLCSTTKMFGSEVPLSIHSLFIFWKRIQNSNVFVSWSHMFPLSLDRRSNGSFSSCP